MRQLRGNVRYRFRSDDHDVNIVIEGDAEWVANHVDELGLTGVGWTMPTGTEVKASNLSSVSRERQAAGVNIEMEDAPESQAPADMGPTPDPGRIPVVRRPIGELNLQEKLSQSGLEPAERPDIIELMDVLEDMDTPVPAPPPALTPWPRHGCANSFSWWSEITASPACAPKTSRKSPAASWEAEGARPSRCGWTPCFPPVNSSKSTAETRQDGVPRPSGCPVGFEPP